ncbi:CHAP domain-containing protein [Faecalicoccus pleomorphus]|uniref:CHAP domain-containing protein n=1 Tax=Faecalicoccus pleomorphus TaxID=1323 RepID=UPI0003B4DA4D|nr:CHAP domain-containing protein [Faecalicoccus pleomorphus]
MGFTENGNQCVAVHPDKFEKFNTPKAGAVFSGVGHNHVGIVIAWDGTNITLKEGNINSKTYTFQEAKKIGKLKLISLCSSTAFIKV